ncbi:RtcB family protein [Methylobacter sp. YRD-M1]|uniref:RtcB family protein n=1 Tax=Methylobacter sp. YRD-M1 TaxID=2911520 RepID=UPI00227A13FF|nr:RtcB family protein [Methylobacter sp. YRD-M1]WAK01610.1 RtcB family protein [Methylobacter sp. YRD-M1]
MGNEESFCSYSYGTRSESCRERRRKKRVSIEEHIAAPEGVECRKDQSVIDENQAAKKTIEQVMHVQSGLVEIMHTLKQVVCIKG